MKKITVFCLSILFMFANVAFACDECDKHIVDEAEKKLLKAVPKLETMECANDVLMKVAITGYPSEHICYQMTEKEYKKARKIAKDKKTLAALKKMHNGEVKK